MNGVVLRKNGFDYYYCEYFNEFVERFEKGIIEYMLVKIDNECIVEKYFYYFFIEFGIVDWDELDEFERRIVEKFVVERKVDFKKNLLIGKFEVRVRRLVFEYFLLRIVSDESFFFVKDELWIRVKLMEKFFF